jgi:hypothetical protein
MRHLIIPALLLLLPLMAGAQQLPAVSAAAQSPTASAAASSSAAPTQPSMTLNDAAHATVTLAQLKSSLASEGRSISGASYRELERLSESPGGLSANLWNAEYVFRIGESTFIVDMRLISTVTLAAFVIVLVLFSPLGFTLFRGGAHALLGSVLQFLRIAPEYGEHLRTEPRKWLAREQSARLAFRRYMHSAFIPAYRNNITAIAFLGTAFLIMSIGFRGIKFMVPHQPEMIIAAIIVEITVLCMLGLSTWYERSESEQAAPVADAVRLPNGQYLEREFVMKAIRDVVADLDAAAATEKGGRS